MRRYLKLIGIGGVLFFSQLEASIRVVKFQTPKYSEGLTVGKATDESIEFNFSIHRLEFKDKMIDNEKTIELNLKGCDFLLGDPWSGAPNTQIVVNYFGENGLGYIPNYIPEGIPWSSGSSSGITNAINKGTFLVLHRDHSNVDGWDEPSYTTSHLVNLSNKDLPFVFSINCLTGMFDYPSGESFTEKFHRMEGGALGVIGATHISYSFVNDTYVWGMWDYFWQDFDPNYPEGEKRDVEKGFLLPGFANCSGKYYLQASSWPYNQGNKTITYRLFHLFGDAFTTIHSEVPQLLEVIHPSRILPNGEEVGREYYIKWEYSNMDGTIKIEISYTPPYTEWEVLFPQVPVENKHQKWIPTVSGSSCKIKISQNEIQDVSDGGVVIKVPPILLVAKDSQYKNYFTTVLDELNYGYTV